MMICSVNESTLSIQFCKPNFGTISLGVDGEPKDLHITMPADWTCKELDIEAAATNVMIRNLTIQTLDFDGASVNCPLALINCPSRISLNGMSGDLDITLPSDCGFTAICVGLNCDISTDFQTTMRNGSHIHGDGSCRIEIEALSGCVKINDSGSNCREKDNHHHTGHHETLSFCAALRSGTFLHFDKMLHCIPLQKHPCSHPKNRFVHFNHFAFIHPLFLVLFRQNVIMN